MFQSLARSKDRLPAVTVRPRATFCNDCFRGEIRTFSIAANEAITDCPVFFPIAAILPFSHWEKDTVA